MFNKTLPTVGIYVSRHLGLLLCNIAIMKRFLPLLMLTTSLFAITGYVRFSEFSVCMDNCSIYYLEDENEEFLTWITYLDSIEILDNYNDRYVDLEGDTVQCVECDAINVTSIMLSSDCQTPVFCVVDPCSVSACTSYPAAECIPNYCDGCWADYYLNGELLNCNQTLLCDEGYTEINGHCFYDNDLAILQNMIDNSYESGIDLDCEDWDDYCGSPNPYMDDPDSWFWKIIDGQEYYFSDGDSIVEPLELGIQQWENGRLISIMCGAYIYCQLSGPIPENINELTEIEQLRLEYNYLSGYLPESICDLNVNYEDYLSFDFTGNLFCPLYPSCIEDYIGEQDTTNCEQLFIKYETVPITYNLHNAFPNPFNPNTTLRYDLPKNSKVNITIYDMMGREVKTLFNQAQDAGYKSLIWDATNNYGKPVSAGIYLYQIQAGKYIQTKKMVLLK